MRLCKKTKAAHSMQITQTRYYTSVVTEVDKCVVTHLFCRNSVSVYSSTHLTFLSYPETLSKSCVKVKVKPTLRKILDLWEYS